MKGPQQRGYWSTRQQLVVITGDNADTWPDALDRLMESARDVIDLWDEFPENPHDILIPEDTTQLGERIDMMRRRLHDLRQWDVSDDI